MQRRQIQQWLGAHTPTDGTESGHRDTMLTLLEAPGPAFQPFDREHFHPGHFTASGLVLSPDGSALLMVYHRGLERWLQPGGHVESGDPDLRATARREVGEETGQTELEPLEGGGVLDVDVHAIPPNGRLPGHQHLDVRFGFQAHRTEIVAGSDVKVAHWVCLDEVHERNDEASMRRIAAKLKSLRGAP